MGPFNFAVEKNNTLLYNWYMVANQKEKYNVKVIRSARKTVSLEINENLEIILRCPKKISDIYIDRFIDEHALWIEKHLEIQKERCKRALLPPDDDEIITLKSQAKKILPEKVRHFAGIMAVNPTGVKITSAKKRLGSCSSNDSLCFSYLLMRYDEEVIDYVVIHELAHIIQHNHSKKFYDIVKKYCPEYKKTENKIRNKL